MVLLILNIGLSEKVKKIYRISVFSPSPLNFPTLICHWQGGKEKVFPALLYCSAECQHADWAAHKPACRRAQRAEWAAVVAGRPAQPLCRGEGGLGGGRI